MTIDILAYELKYKDDEMVMDLLREYQDGDSYEEMKDKIDNLENVLDEIRNLV